MLKISLTALAAWRDLPSQVERAALRLLLVVDYRGRYDGRLPTLQAVLWPGGDWPPQETLERMLVYLAERGIIRRYEVSGVPYIFVEGGEGRLSGAHSKWPDPPWAACKTFTPDPLDPEVGRLKLIREQEFVILESHVAAWKRAYPAIDMVVELARMEIWCAENVANRKTRQGINRFIHRWLGKAQDRTAGVSGPSKWGAGNRRALALGAVYGDA